MTIHGWDTAPTPTGFAEIVRDDLAVLHSEGLCVFCSPHSNDKILLAYEQAGGLKQWEAKQKKAAAPMTLLSPNLKMTLF